VKGLVRPRARSVLVVVAALIGSGMVITLGVVGYALLSDSGGPSGEKNSDPRAASGSDQRISFEQAVRDLRLTLPATVSQVRYMARNDSRPYFLKISFVTSCSAIPEFTADNGLVRSGVKEAGAIELQQLRRAARELDRPLPEGRTATVWDDGNDHDSVNRAIAETALDGRNCQVVGTFEDYS
jgi:hypothetical protein